MSDAPTWYSAQYHSEPTAENAFGLSALRLTPDREMEAFLAAGGKLTDWLKMKEARNVQN